MFRIHPGTYVPFSLGGCSGACFAFINGSSTRAMFYIRPGIIRGIASGVLKASKRKYYFSCLNFYEEAADMQVAQE
jgi:hypothetical protein